MSPAGLGHPDADEIVRPNVSVIEFTDANMNGDASKRKRRPLIDATIHLSRLVYGFSHDDITLTIHQEFVN